MKTIKNYVWVLLLALPLLATAQDLTPVVQTLNKAKEVSELMQVRSKLERFSMAKPDVWLANYYLAYVDVQLSFQLPSKDEKAQYLREAEDYLNKLPELKGAELSEVYTLKGLRLYGLIASDPQTNGPRYSGEIMANYEKALALNPNNPRAMILRALFKNNMAQFMHQANPDFQQEVDKAAAAFETENTTAANPAWGRAWVQMARNSK